MNKLLIGFTTGLVVGLLLSPASGAENRARIVRKGKALKEKFEDLVETVEDQLDALRSTAVAAIEAKVEEAEAGRY